ncbi:MAG: sigma-70 family RNA polymerase sigma factor [Dehalococcoidaceae bacterium]|nr:sigma-70 family RNA polymerase sigma factor [Dehalococcoidaceae bacterium]
MRTATGRQNSSDARNMHEAELAGLYPEYYDRIARYAAAHIGSRLDGEDIAGEVFLRALRSLGSYRKQSVPMQAWLFQIAHNLVVDYLRQKNRRRTVDIESVILESPGNPETVVERGIDLERVAGAMSRLTSDQRQVLTLRFLGELSSKETAEVMGKTDGAVREMQRAALAKLRTILGDE